jgi:hypothetical protein
MEVTSSEQRSKFDCQNYGLLREDHNERQTLLERERAGVPRKAELAGVRAALHRNPGVKRNAVHQGNLLMRRPGPRRFRHWSIFV